MLNQGAEAYARLTALFLFSPRYIRDHYDQVQAWCQRSAASVNPEVMSRRIDMILAHDQLERLSQIQRPTLVVVGGADACTPLHFSEEVAGAVPWSEADGPGGHLIYKEEPDRFHQTVREFIVALG